MSGGLKMRQMSFAGRAPPEPAGGAYSAPADPLAALKLLALDPWRLRRSETEHSGSSFSSHSNTAGMPWEIQYWDTMEVI